MFDPRFRLSQERWLSSGKIGAYRYCAWRSTWKTASGWAYAEDFTTPEHLWIQVGQRGVGTVAGGWTCVCAGVTRGWGLGAGGLALQERGLVPRSPARISIDQSCADSIDGKKKPWISPFRSIAPRAHPHPIPPSLCTYVLLHLCRARVLGLGARHARATAAVAPSGTARVP